MSIRKQGGSLIRALEEARYGPDALLNLRDSMPTEAEATERAEAWLRERQVIGIAEALLITGRGRGSPGGVAVVREGIRKLLHSLKRRGIVDDFSENGPGSFLVRVAPLRRLFDAPRRKRDARAAPAAEAAGMGGALGELGPEAFSELRKLATMALTSLGIEPSEEFVQDEIRRQFSLLTASLPDVREREQLLREAVLRAIREYEEE